MRILALGTYPTRKPVHGGQRRVSRIGDYYRRFGHDYRYACVYAPTAYSGEAVSEFDYPYVTVGGIYSDVPFIDDLGSGAFAAQEEAPYRHFRKLVEEYQPDVIQLEQPFMWPLVKRLFNEGVCSGALLAYSSHNYEAPLKRDILESVGVARDKVVGVARMIEDIEREIIEAAQLVMAVSQADADRYDVLSARAGAIVVRNGTDIPAKPVAPPDHQEMEIDQYLFFVGSAYPPNIEGFGKFALSQSLYGLPPKKLLAICGGAADGIYASPYYLPHSDSYGDRVHFFKSPSDEELSWIQQHARGTLLPIASGGGSNLKTAEAISACKWIVATPMAMRSFEDFTDRPGIIVARTPKEFRDGMLDVLYAKPLKLTAAEQKKSRQLYWPNLLENSGAVQMLEAEHTKNAKARPAR